MKNTSNTKSINSVNLTTELARHWNVGSGRLFMLKHVSNTAGARQVVEGTYSDFVFALRELREMRSKATNRHERCAFTVAIQQIARALVSHEVAVGTTRGRWAERRTNLLLAA